MDKQDKIVLLAFVAFIFVFLFSKPLLHNELRKLGFKLKEKEHAQQ